MHFKDNTGKVLREWYGKHGLDRTIELGRQMFSHAKFREVLEGNYPEVQGAVAENIAYLQVKDFITKNNLKGWGVHEGLIIKGTDPERNYLTELDLLVYSPGMMFLLEVKSYGGTKRITKECTIEKRGKTYDVYSQHSKHVTALLDLFEHFKKPEISRECCCLSIVYLFSNDPFYDKRTPEWKTMMPVMTEKDFPTLLERYINSPPIWEINFIRMALREMEQNKKKLTSKHLEYVKGLHPD